MLKFTANQPRLRERSQRLAWLDCMALGPSTSRHYGGKRSPSQRSSSCPWVCIKSEKEGYFLRYVTRLAVPALRPGMGKRSNRSCPPSGDFTPVPRETAMESNGFLTPSLHHCRHGWFAATEKMSSFTEESREFIVREVCTSEQFCRAAHAESTHIALGINWQLARWPAQNQTNNSPARTYPERLYECLNDRRRAHVARLWQQKA